MDQGIISMRYAKALLRYAEENGEAKTVYGETARLSENLLRVPALQRALLNPVLNEEKKRELLLAAAVAEGSPSKSLSDFITLLLRKQRTDTVLRIAYAYGTCYRERYKIVRGRLVLPGEIDDKIFERLSRKVEASAEGRVDFEKVIDPSIIGGFVLEYDTYRLDASVRGRFKRIREQLV